VIALPTTSRPMMIIVIATIALFVVTGILAIAPKLNPLPTAHTPVSQVLPLAFIPNEGQLASDIRLQVHGRGGTLSFLPNEVLFDLAADTHIRLQWEGANTTPDVAGVTRLPGVANVMRGNDPTQWHTDIPMYGGALYESLYPGIDLRYDGSDGTLKGTYTVSAGVDPSQIRWQFAGAESVTVDGATGDLQIALKNGERMTEQAPISWQTIQGERVMVPTRYQLDGYTVRFDFPDGYDPNHPLVIDPTLLYSSYIGGNSSDSTTGVAVDTNGNIYLTGETYSTDFLGQSDPVFGSSDIFVAKLNVTGTQVLYLSIIGTSDSEYARAVEVDGQGNAVVTLDSFTTDFPMVNALWENREDPADTAIIVKLNSSGNFVYSTYLPLRGLSATHNLALDGAGNAHITGIFYGAEDSEGNWLGDQVALIKLSATGQELILGGHIGATARNSDERGNAITVDDAGNIYIVGIQVDGYADEVFGTPNAHQPTCGEVANGETWCGKEGFIYVLDVAGALTYASYHGGKAGDEPVAVATNGNGTVLIVGNTYSPDFPTVNPLQATCPITRGICAQGRGFVSLIQIQPTQSTVQYSTYWGSPEVDSTGNITGAALDGAGNIYVAGWTNGQQFPLKDPIQSQLNNSICNLGGSERYCYDNFVSKFTASGQLAFSTYFGATFDDLPYDIALDGNNNILFVGVTEANDFPTTNGAIQPNNLLADDGFLVKIGMGSATPPTVTPGGPTATATTPSITPIPNAKKNYLPLVGGNP
jgi:hypothetical protein